MPRIVYRSVSGAVAFYSFEDDTIYVSPSMGFGEVRSLSQSAERGWFSQPNPVLHEYSHRHHYLCDPDGYEASCRRQLSDEQRSVVVAKVSGYAATSTKEFVAEYIAGRLSGKTYGKDVQKIVEYVTSGAVRL